MGLLILSANIQILRHRHGLHEMIRILSDFKQSGKGISQKLKLTEKNMKTILKIVYYGGFLVAYFMAYCIILGENCAKFRNAKHCLLFEYYMPFDLKSWQLTLIMLVQIHTLRIGITVSFLIILLYWYSFELLVIRIQNLYGNIHDIHLTKNKKKNSKLLIPSIKFHQNITFSMFKFTKDFFASFLVPAKVCTMCSLTISTTQLALRQDLISLSMLLMTLLGSYVNYTIGQRLTISADSIAEAVYNLNWCDADVSTRRDLVTFLCMTQKPLALEVPFFGEVSYLEAANEYKKTYAFYNWMSTMTRKS
ncbi:odorant receptor 85c-like [Onthophagus taurus]|uniref:odorant receptor 85c-like n=1 Tax=Onthophagus taurus TaxID=166361 RepID=UPI0039BDF2DE